MNKSIKTLDWLKGYGLLFPFTKEFLETYPYSHMIMSMCNDDCGKEYRFGSNAYHKLMGLVNARTKRIEILIKACNLEMKKEEAKRIALLEKGTKVIVNKNTRSDCKGFITNVPSDKNGQFLIKYTGWNEGGIGSHYAKNIVFVEAAEPSVKEAPEPSVKASPEACWQELGVSPVKTTSDVLKMVQKQQVEMKNQLTFVNEGALLELLNKQIKSLEDMKNELISML